MDILDSYFDPEKEAIVPVVKKTFRSRRRSFKKDKSHRGSHDEPNGDQLPSSPDSTVRSPRKRRPRRRQNNRRSFNKDGSDNKKHNEPSDGKVHLTEITGGGN